MKGRQGRETSAPAVHQAIWVAETGSRAGGGWRQQHRQEAEDTEEDVEEQKVCNDMVVDIINVHGFKKP